MKYRINKNTKQIIEDNNNLGEFFYSEDWRKATEEEINEHLVSEKRKEKNLELKLKRDSFKKENGYESEYECLNLQTGFGEYTVEEKNKYRIFIDSLIKKYDSFKKQINESKTVEELNNININFEV